VDCASSATQAVFDAILAHIQTNVRLAKLELLSKTLRVSVLQEPTKKEILARLATSHAVRAQVLILISALHVSSELSLQVLLPDLRAPVHILWFKASSMETASMLLATIRA